MQGAGCFEWGQGWGSEQQSCKATQQGASSGQGKQGSKILETGLKVVEYTCRQWGLSAGWEEKEMPHAQQQAQRERHRKQLRNGQTPCLQPLPHSSLQNNGRALHCEKNLPLSCDKPHQIPAGQGGHLSQEWDCATSHTFHNCRGATHSAAKGCFMQQGSLRVLQPHQYINSWTIPLTMKQAHRPTARRMGL